jgi:hypothetical protein
MCTNCNCKTCSCCCQCPCRYCKHDITYKDKNSYRYHKVCFTCKRGWKTSYYSRHPVLNLKPNTYRYFKDDKDKCSLCGNTAVYVGQDCQIPKKNIAYK